MNQLKVNFKTPLSKIYEGSATSVILDTPNGQITVLPDHEPMVGIIEVGEILVTENNKTQSYLSGHGIFKIKDNNISILCDETHSPDSLTVEAIEEAKERAKKLSEESKDARTNAFASAELEKSLFFLNRIKRHHRNIS